MVTIKSGSRVSIAAASFSIYAFKELKEQLGDIRDLRFIFTSPSFITEKTDKQRREFYIPQIKRERNLFGSEFEIKLRNELSLKAVAKECADWIRQKACFKSNHSLYLPINILVDLDCKDNKKSCVALPNLDISTGFGSVTHHCGLCYP